MATVRVVIKVSLLCFTQNTTGLRVAKLQSGTLSKPYALAPVRCPANLTHIDSQDPGFQVKQLQPLKLLPVRLAAALISGRLPLVPRCLFFFFITLEPRVA